MKSVWLGSTTLVALVALLWSGLAAAGNGQEHATGERQAGRTRQLRGWLEANGVSLASLRQIPIRVPAGLKPVTPKFDPATLKRPLPGEQPDRTAFANYLGLVKEAERQICRLTRGRNRQIRTVIYPASGHDSAYVLTVFPNAELYLGITGGRFIEDYQEDQVLRVASQPAGNSYIHHNAVGYDLGARLISNMLHGNARLEILDVFGFQTRTDQNRHRHPRWHNNHGLVLFDAGGHAGPKRYLHIDQRIKAVDNTQFLADQWWRFLIPRRDLALVYKGSQSVDEATMMQEIERALLAADNSLFVAPRHESRFGNFKDFTEPVIDLPVGYNIDKYNKDHPGVLVLSIN